MMGESSGGKLSLQKNSQSMYMLDSNSSINPATLLNGQNNNGQQSSGNQ